MAKCFGGAGGTVMTLVGHFEPSITGVLAERSWSRDRFQGELLFAILDQAVPTEG